jgi:hypothetical protein
MWWASGGTFRNYIFGQNDDFCQLTFFLFFKINNEDDLNQRWNLGSIKSTMFSYFVQKIFFLNHVYLALMPAFIFKLCLFILYGKHWD